MGEERRITLAWFWTDDVDCWALVLSFGVPGHKYQDPRLAPFLTNTIVAATGAKLFSNLRVLNKLGPVESTGAGLVQPLLERALADGYSRTEGGGYVFNVHLPVVRRSCFDEAARALHQITGGKIGRLQNERANPLPPAEKQALAKAWREKWKEKTASRK
jgi:hypothetical protein